MVWIVRLVQVRADGEAPFVDVMTINRPDDLDDIANLGLTLTEAKQLLARVQREISTAQACEGARGPAAGMPLPRWDLPGERLS